MQTMYVDFETRSVTDIKFGLSKYFQTAELLCMAYAFDDEEVKLWTPKTPFPQEVIDYINDGGIISGYNVMFERYCFQLVDVDVKISQLRDTQAQSLVCNIGSSLGDTAKNLRLDQQKEKRGKYLIKHLCIPRKPTKSNPNIWFEEPELYEELGEYCIQDVVTERAISKRLPQLSDYEQRVWELSQRMNERGVPVDLKLVYKMASLVEQNEAELKKESKELLGFSVTQASLLKDFVGLDNVQAETVRVALQDESIQGDKRRALELRADLSSTAGKKFKKVIDIVAPDSTIKGLIGYHGAATGRFSSRGGFNVQNMARPKLKTDTQTLIDDCMNLPLKEIIAKHGSFSDVSASLVRAIVHGDFIDYDFSSIENRVGSWIVGDQPTLDLFAKGLDQYKDMATTMYNVAYDDVTADQRQIAKAAILGAMFGQGAKGFVSFAGGYGVILSMLESETIIKSYREKYHKIASAWKRYDGCAKTCIYTGEPQQISEHTSFELDNGFLVMNLPSKRKLYFFNPRIQEKQTPWGTSSQVVTAWTLNTYTRKYGQNTLLGSSLFQSAVQATARDLLVESMLRIEDAGVDIYFSIHDEIIAQHNVIPEEKFHGLFCEVPAWAEGLPIAGEGWTGTRYQK